MRISYTSMNFYASDDFASLFTVLNLPLPSDNDENDRIPNR